MGSVEVNTSVSLDINSSGHVSASLYTQSIGDGVTTVFPITHNLGSPDVFVSTRNLLTGVVGQGDPAVSVVNDNQITVAFTAAPAVGEYRVLVLAVK